jgi:hypothetical protein
MRMIHPLVLALCCTAVLAQPGRKATTVGNAESLTALAPSMTPGSVFASLSPTVSEIRQINVLPALDAAGARIPGRFQLNLTVVRGGGSGPSLLLGILDTNPNPWTFTDNTATLLPGVTVNGLSFVSMTTDLLVLFCDNGSFVHYTVRPNRTVPFQALATTAMGTGTTPIEPTVMSHENGNFITFRQTSGGLNYIARTQIDRNRYPMDPRVVVSFGTLVPPPFLDAHSGNFLIDGNGSARATIHAVDMGGPGSHIRARPWFNAIIRPGNTNVENSKQFFTGPNDDTEIDFPGAIAGSTIYAHRPAGGAWGAPLLVRAVASCGGEVPAAGGVFKLSAWLPYFAPSNPPQVPWAVTILIGTPGPDLTVPGFRGKLALALSPSFLALPAKTWTAGTLSADWSVPAPPLPGGTVLWGQTLAYDPAGSFDGDGDGNGDTFYFGNTAPLLWN